MSRILIVDDSKMSRRMLKSIVEGIGHDVVGEAENGERAVALYEELKPDAVTMDITMPGKDGISALKEIRAKDPTALVIMVTAAGQSNMLMEAIKAGAKEFICKPYEPEQIINAMNEVL